MFVLGVAVVAFSGLVYWLFTPLPGNIADPWKLRLVLAAYKLTGLLTQIPIRLGLASWLDVARVLSPIIFKAASQPVYAKHLTMKDTEFDGVPVRIYRPRDLTTSLPCLVYYHGGGFIMYSVDTYDYVLRRLCLATQMTIVSVEYRLSPECVFPGPLNDCISATIHVLKHGSSYGVDTNNVGIAGDSAGGCLAAAVARSLTYDKPRGIPPIKYQALIYPMLQAFDMRTSSFVNNADVMPVLLSVDMVIGAWINYLVGPPTDEEREQFRINGHVTTELCEPFYKQNANSRLLSRDIRMQTMQSHKGHTGLARRFETTLTNPLYNPLIAHDISKLPTTYILTAEYDVLRDDGLLYAKRLSDAGVDVFHTHCSNGYHAVFSFTRFHIGRKTLDDVASFLNDARSGKLLSRAERSTRIK